MADTRFYQSTGPHTLGRIAALISAQPLTSEISNILVSDIAEIELASNQHVAFYFDRRYEQSLKNCQAAAIVCGYDAQMAPASSHQLILVKSSRLAFRQVCDLFYPEPSVCSRTDSGASIHPDANIEAGCNVHAGATIAAGAHIGTGSTIGTGAYIGEGVVMGSSCRVGRNASITHARLGSRVVISHGVVIGEVGFGFQEVEGRLKRGRHIGGVNIGDDAEIGANCVIDRGVISDTRIGAGTKLDNLIQVAHGVVIGRNCVIAAQSGIAGSTVIGDRVMIGGRVAISDHLVVGSGARVAGGSGVMRNIGENQSVGGYPAMPVRAWHRQTIESGGFSTTRAKR